MGKLTILWPFSMAMLDYQRVHLLTILNHIFGCLLLVSKVYIFGIKRDHLEFLDGSSFPGELSASLKKKDLRRLFMAGSR